MKTHTDILKHNPCKEGLEYAKQFSTLHEAWHKCERGDWMIWLLRRTKQLDKKTSVTLAVKFAERVLHIFEGKYPDNKKPREAIDAALEWLENPTEENQLKARYAADADAAAAAYAAYAADAAAAAAAAYAVDAAYAAANAAAAAYAAYAAVDDAYDAAYAAAYAVDANADRNSERKVQADIIREVVGNPFQV